MDIKHVSVTFEATIPTQAYGNISVNVAWSGDLAPDETPETATRAIFDRIRIEVAEAVKPIAAQKLKTAQAIVQSLPPKERDSLMQTLGVVQWLETVAPELKFANGTANSEDA